MVLARVVGERGLQATECVGVGVVMVREEENKQSDFLGIFLSVFLKVRSKAGGFSSLSLSLLGGRKVVGKEVLESLPREKECMYFFLEKNRLATPQLQGR